MKTLITTLALIAITSLHVLAQDEARNLSKIDQFVSKSGSIVKFEDYSLENIPLSYGVSEARIRKVFSGGDVKLFYQISYESTHSTKTASVDTEEMEDLITALGELIKATQNDLQSSANYIENKFITDDGAQLGYYINNKKISWYFRLEKYGSNNTIFFKNIEAVAKSLMAGKAKMKELSI